MVFKGGGRGIRLRNREGRVVVVLAEGGVIMQLNQLESG